jgi:hypothetical protein
MSNAFTNFLGGIGSSLLDSGAIMKDYQHADRLYVKESYARAPKVGFLYFVSFNINTDAIKNDKTKWGQKYWQNVGMLVKKTDLPKFSIETETLNQYNRKTVIQKAIKYNPINLEFHDDNSDITNDLWKNYFQYYYADSTYGQKGKAGPQFTDTKFGDTFYNYGLANTQKDPFFTSIDIYVLHQKKFTQYTLVNPIITEWSHDTLDQSENAKILTNKLGIAYETVLYNSGNIKRGTEVDKFRAFYDSTPSPISIGGKGSNTLLGAGGVLDGASSVFGSIQEGNFLGAALQARTLVSNARNLTRAGLKSELTNVITNSISSVAALGSRNDLTLNGATDLGIRSVYSAAPTIAKAVSLIPPRT